MVTPQSEPTSPPRQRRTLLDLVLAKSERQQRGTTLPQTAPPVPKQQPLPPPPSPSRQQSLPPPPPQQNTTTDSSGRVAGEKVSGEKPSSVVPKPMTPQGESWHSKKLFTRKEERLPHVAVQNDDDQQSLYQKVDAANDHMQRLLDRGKGVARALGARIFAPGEMPRDEDFAKPGAILQFAPPKGLERAKEKVTSDYGGHWGHLLDVVRASVAVDNMQEMHRALNQMRRDGAVLVRKPVDRFSSPTPAGYRDAMLNVRLPNGVIGEVQMHLKPVLRAKQMAHQDYETMRSIEAKTKMEKRPMNEGEKIAYGQALAHSRDVYQQAWKEAGGTPTPLPPDWNLGKSLPPGGPQPTLEGPSPTSQDETGDEGNVTQYYVTGNGIVLRWEEGGHPEVFTGEKWTPYPHLTAFAYDAQPIGAAEAKHLMYLRHDHDDDDAGDEGMEMPDLSGADEGETSPADATGNSRRFASNHMEDEPADDDGGGRGGGARKPLLHTQPGRGEPRG